MANFLDLTTGMPALWAKIKSKFYTKAEVDALIPEDEVMRINVTSSGSGENISYSADKTYNEINTAFQNGKTCIVIYDNGKVLYLVDKTSTAFIFSMVVGPNATYLTNYIIKITKTKVSVYFKTSQPSVIAPEMDGTATVGASDDYARADHVHPTDTSRVAVNQGTANASKVLIVGSDGNVTLTSDIIENFIVNATNSGSNYTVDKTYNEIIEAFNSGKNCFCIWTNGNGTYHVYRLHAIINNTIHFIYFFETDADSIWAYDLTINSDNIVTVYGNSIRGASSNDLDYAGKNGITSNLNVNDSGYFVSRTAQNNYSSNTLFWINAKQIAKAKTDIATGDTLTKGTNYEITTIADELANMTTDLTGLADTNISNPANGQVLQYDATSSKWVNATLPTGITETRVNELIAAALAQYGDGDTATYGYNDASEVNY